MGPRLRAVLALALGGLPALAAAGGSGLTVNPDDLPWPRLQSRISLQTASPWSTAISGSRSNPGLGTLSLMSDYYVSPSFLGPQRAGGFRATSGLMIGPRNQPWALPSPSLGNGGPATDRGLLGLPTATLVPGDTAGESPALPYVGVGYTGLSVRGGWSFSADLGMVSLNAGGAVKFGRVVNGSQSLDDTLRDMRWSPLVQLGVSYSF
jgi:hypothetical protein